MAERREGDSCGDIRDHAEFERFYAAHYGRCRSLLRRKARARATALGIPDGLLHDLIHDAVVDAFEDLRKRPERYNPTLGSLSTLFNTIALRKLEKAFRSLEREFHHRSKASLDVVAPVRGDDREMRSVVLRADVSATLARLSPAQAAAMIRHYEEGWPVRDVAYLVGNTEKGTQSLLQRGRASFAREWTLQGKAEP